MRHHTRDVVSEAFDAVNKIKALEAERDQLRSLLRDVLHERLDGEGLPCWLRDDIRHALEKGAEL